jgi:ABC-type transport system involved in cytochrome c biogenesis permease component
MASADEVIAKVATLVANLEGLVLLSCLVLAVCSLGVGSTPNRLRMLPPGFLHFGLSAMLSQQSLSDHR